MAFSLVARGTESRWFPILDWCRALWRTGRSSGPSGYARRRAAAARANEPPPDAATLRQWLYGPGCLNPCDAEYLVDLVKVFGLGPEMTMLEFGPGMGGSSAAIAQAFNTYIEGLESDPDLVRAAHHFLPTTKSAKHVRIQHFDPATFELRPNFYFRCLAREATYCLADKQRVFAMAGQGLRRLGHIIVTDFVRNEAVPPSAEYEDWAALQPSKPQLWTARQYIECLQKLGFDVQASRDATADYRRMILRSWREALERPEVRQLRGRRGMPLIDEAERVIRTLAALDSGALRYFYLFGLNGGPKPS